MDTVLHEVTTEEVRILLDQFGLNAEQVKEDLFNLELPNGLRGHLITYGGSHVSSLQLRAGFSGFDRVEPRHLLNWNRRYRFSKAYFDADNDPVLESDLRLEGVTPEAIHAFVHDFGDQVTLFFSYLRMIDAGLVE
ncbi:YbjN domain-containing protein [Meiothermus ruber]|uniref:YbjN domain-containing protein n=1 Tax=Meiothermus ruber TaxID=277 RepID=UPI00055F02C4|nr:YbjN domain-containing protein [Meiothermus ruber]